MFRKSFKQNDSLRQPEIDILDNTPQRPLYQKSQRMNFSQMSSKKFTFSNLRANHHQNRQPLIRQQSFHDHRPTQVTSNNFKSQKSFYKPRQNLNMNNRVVSKQDQKKMFFKKQSLPSKININKTETPKKTKTQQDISKVEQIQDEETKPQKMLERQFSINNAKIFYGLKTCNGLVRQYNEDRLSILLNYQNDKLAALNLSVNYFGIYDGHGGERCCDFVQNNLHHYIFESQFFPNDIIKAISEGFQRTENEFTKLAFSKAPLDRSGSCAVVLLIVNDTGYIANLGDSRIFCSEKMKKLVELSRDHKPEAPQEKRRIIDCGGQVVKYLSKKNNDVKDLPYRIYPGGLSVARSFGDVHIKNKEFGGKKGILSSKPDISVYKITKDTDYFFLGCDGIFDVCSSTQLFREIKYFIKDCRSKNKSLCTKVVNYVIEKTMLRQSTDNLSCIFIHIKNLINF